mmetsp:Transcript_14327/g.21654  ORF Transcript_14327/g.21654 Transcript_14327/m.21654 type:complete len:514 (+) Transcript_14327:54-1595(+)
MIYIGILKQCLYNLNENINPLNIKKVVTFLKHFEDEEGDETAKWDPNTTDKQEVRIVDKENQIVFNTLQRLGFQVTTIAGGVFVILMDEKQLIYDEVQFLIKQLENYLDTLDLEDKDEEAIELEEKIKREKTQEETFRQKLARFFLSKRYFYMLVGFTIFVLFVSVLVKVLDYFEVNEKDPDRKGVLDTIGFAFGIVYVILQVFLLIELLLRLLVVQKQFFYDEKLGSKVASRINWRFIVDGIIVVGDMIMTIALTIIWAAGSDFVKNPVENIGILLFLRCGVFMMYHKRLAGVIIGMMESLSNFIMSFVFLFIIIYLFGIAGKALYSQVCTGLTGLSNDNIPVDQFCYRFRDYYQGTFSMYQVMTSESWSEAFARPAELKLQFSYIFFGAFHSMTAFVILNVISGLVVDSIMSRARNQDEEKQQEFEQKMKEIDDSIPDTYYENMGYDKVSKKKIKTDNWIDDDSTQVSNAPGAAAGVPAASSQSIRDLQKRLIRIEAKLNYLSQKGRILGF